MIELSERAIKTIYIYVLKFDFGVDMANGELSLNNKDGRTFVCDGDVFCSLNDDPGVYTFLTRQWKKC